MTGIKFIGDSPAVDVDGLGFDDYVDILTKAIDNFDFDDSLTIGIHGCWGFGKTSLMRMIEKHYNKTQNTSAVKTVWFDAWAYGKDEPVGLALLRRIVIEFKNKSSFKKESKRFLENVGKLGIEAILRKTLTMTYDDAKKLFEEEVDVKSTLRDNFEKVIKENLADGRLVVFIDDLDRCLPENVIDVLEVIKLYLDVHRCVFVIGVDQVVVEQAIEARYRTDVMNGKNENKLILCGKDYVNKIIQVPFVIPPVRVDEMAVFIDSLDIDEDEKKYARIVAKGADCNPRKVKMFLNILRLRIAIAEKTGGEIKPEVLAKLVVIEYAFSEFYEDIKKYLKQDFVCDMEKLAKGVLDEKLEKVLSGSKIRQGHNNNEDLKNLLKEEPFFCGIDLEPYIHLSGNKILEENYVSDESLFDDLYSGDKLKQDNAVDVLKNMSDLDKDRYLSRLLSDLKGMDVHVRVGAVSVLGKLDNSRAFEPLINVLLNDDDVGVRSAVLLSLGNLGDSRAFEPLIKALNDNDDEVRDVAAYSLGNLGDSRAVDPLTSALNDNDDEVRRSAVSALGSIGDSKSVDSVISALNDKNARVRQFAVIQLGKIGNYKAIDPLRLALKDKDIAVSILAEKAIEKIKAKEKQR